MNLTQETNDYFSTIERRTKILKGIHPKDPLKFPGPPQPAIDGMPDYEDYLNKCNNKPDINTNKIWTSFDDWKSEKDFRDNGNKMALEHWAEFNLKDKLKTTPSAGLTKISKTFTINWKKLHNFFGFR